MHFQQSEGEANAIAFAEEQMRVLNRMIADKLFSR